MNSRLGDVDYRQTRGIIKQILVTMIAVCPAVQTAISEKAYGGRGDVRHCYASVISLPWYRAIFLMLNGSRNFLTALEKGLSIMW